MSPTISAVIWIAISFFCGSLPLSFWLGKIALGTDIRQYGDGNPGAANVWRAGGKWWGILAILLDGIKGLIPVACANFIAGVQGWALVAVTIAPMLGHAFSPFLGLRGGKSLAVTFGAWAGLTLAEIPLVLGMSFAFWLFLLSSESWAVMAGMLTTLVYILIRSPDPVWIGVWLGSFVLLMWKHRDGFRKRPHPPRFRSSSRRKGTEGSLPGV